MVTSTDPKPVEISFPLQGHCPTLIRDMDMIHRSCDEDPPIARGGFEKQSQEILADPYCKGNGLVNEVREENGGVTPGFEERPI